MLPVSLSPPREHLLSRASLASGRRIGYFLAAVGIVILGCGEYLFFRERAFLSHAQHAIAHVVAVEQTHTRFGPRYAAVFAYADRTGKPWRILSNQSTTTPDAAMGQTADVVYLPDNPARGQIEGFFERWGLALILGIGGGVVAMVGYVGTGIFEWLERTSRFP